MFSVNVHYVNTTMCYNDWNMLNHIATTKYDIFHLNLILNISYFLVRIFNSNSNAFMNLINKRNYIIKSTTEAININSNENGHNRPFFIIIPVTVVTGHENNLFYTCRINRSEQNKTLNVSKSKQYRTAWIRHVLGELWRYCRDRFGVSKSSCDSEGNSVLLLK